ncbi:hypothetical protein AVEN_94407-1, partial [Araneus ventricosus]
RPQQTDGESPPEDGARFLQPQAPTSNTMQHEIPVSDLNR